MARQEFRLNSVQEMPGTSFIIRAFIQTDSGNPVIGSLTESNVGNVKSLFFAVRNYANNTGVIVVAILENSIAAGEIDVTIDQDGAVFNHPPIPYLA